MRGNIIKFVLAFMLAFFVYVCGKGTAVHAADTSFNAFEMCENAVKAEKNEPQIASYASDSKHSNAKLRNLNAFITRILYAEGGDSSESGVTELDNSLTRGKKFLVGIIHFFGAAVALFGVVFAAIGFLGRDNEQKIIGITAFIVGVAIFFAPQIVNAVVGQTVF